MRRVLALSMVAVVLALGCKRPEPPPDPEKPAEEPPPPAPRAERCAALDAPPFVIGDGASAKAPGEATDDSLPFAAEVGDAITWAGGFAVGTLYESARVSTAAVALLGVDGKGGKLVSLGPAHGDVEPPRLASHGSTIVLGLLEPEPNGRSLRLAKIEAGAVTWGATVHESRDESQAYDLLLGEKKGIVVWDEDGPKRGVIQASTFDAASVASATPARTISPADADAESPRLVSRPGGFWLAYVGRRPSDDDADARYVAEEIGFRWIEVLPLDANGSPTGAARAVTSKDGHVIAFDVAPTAEGGAVLVWRDDDTPSGSGGGRLMRALVHPSTVDAPGVLAEEGIGAGVPSLMPGWIAVTDASGATRMSPMSPTGELTGTLEVESLIGNGEPIAASGEAFLVARPAGKAMKLLVARCK